MSAQERSAAIVGIHEYPSRDVEGRVSALQIKAESARRALEDAGLGWGDIDALYDAGEVGGPNAGGMTPLHLAAGPIRAGWRSPCRARGSRAR